MNEFMPGDVVSVVRCWAASVLPGMIGNVVEQDGDGDVLVSIPGTVWTAPGIYLANNDVMLLNRPEPAVNEAAVADSEGAWRDDPAHAQVEDTTYDGAVPTFEVHDEVHVWTTADDANPKDALGIKKAPLRFVPWALRILAAPAMALGAHKYGPFNWRTKPVKLTVYLEAIDRHLAAFADGQDNDPESGASHLSHAAACLGIIADAQALGNLIDDRFEPGPAADMLAALDMSKADASQLIADIGIGALRPSMIDPRGQA